MLRAALLVLGLAACGPRLHTSAPLVEPPPTPLPATGIQLAAGEQMTWDAYCQGMLIGSADLGVTSTDARALFSTTMLAKAFAKVRYQLTSALDRGMMTGSRQGFTM